MPPRTEPARGMRDFLPEDVRRREFVIGVIKGVYERYGFEPLETPAAENLETLMGKYGEEGNQLIFKILKRGEHEVSGEADLALRYDLTVPLARVIAHHQAKLPRLFKRYQIQPVWRADRPARGRFREFFQCDVDSLGSTSPIVEAELCAAVSDALSGLGFRDFTIRVNHRQLLTAILNQASIPEPLHGTALVAVDKLDKIGPDGVRAEMVSRGIAAECAATLLDTFAFIRNEQLGSRSVLTDEAALASFENVAAIFDLASGTSADGHLQFDPSLARGLSYYTGAIMEINVPDLAGSLGGGGRYDNLVGMFLGQTIPACGFSLGLERILVVMGERGMFPASVKNTPADVMTAVFDPKDAPHALRVAATLRRAGLRVITYPEPDKIGKQIKYADARGIPFVAILGGDEIGNGTVTIKDLAHQTQTTYDQAAAGAAILEGLKHRG
ncbi:MAG TPA: histidine--tRNA ligase [Vicinamibacterales bacterium]|nr:histidine--tRNA ligase [Vicinamibacterales bacterium]